MARAKSTLLAFNRGLVSYLALARLDIQRLALSAETMTNWIPRLLGSMMLRPGTTYLRSTKSDAAARMVPFVFSTTDSAGIELTASTMRVMVSDAVITRPSVTTTIANGNFDTNLTGWTDSDEVGATSAWATGGYMQLTGDGTNEARRDQQLTVSGGNVNTEHGFAVHVVRGDVTLRLGSSAGGTQYGEFTLRPGRHSIAITPTGDVHVRFAYRGTAPALVSSIAIESAGAMEVATPWGVADLDHIRFDQSGDVVFVACVDHQPRRIERQNSRSWSVVEYQSTGPFRDQNTSAITITPSALSGSVTLTASKPLFSSQHVGAQFRLESSGQNVESALSAADTYTDPIRVTGVLNARLFGIAITGTFVGTVTLQRSLGTPGDWSDVSTYTTTTSTTYTDGLDNQIAYYRLGFKPGEYTSGTATCSLAYDAGTAQGIVRVTAYTSSTQVTADVEDALGAATATSTWWESAWSDYRGWPSAVGLHDGRLWWAASNRVDGSVSDDFTNFDEEAEEGDAGPIRRTIGTGPVDSVNWVLSLGQLLFGTDGMELLAKSSSFDEPLTPTQFALKGATTYGSAAVGALRIDKSGIFVGRTGGRIFEISPDSNGYSYTSADLTVLNPGLLSAGVQRTAVQRFPDTRIHCVLADGTVKILLLDQLEKANCWVNYETDGDVEDALVLPGTSGGEDQVYYVVNRTINGNTKRYVEKWALEGEAIGAATNKIADCGLVYSGAATATITGLSHLEGKTVVAWGNTKALGSYTVASGQITLPEAVTWAFIGPGYTAQFKSARFALASASGNPLTQPKRLGGLGLVLANVHAAGIQFGQDFSYLEDMPLVEGAGLVGANTVHTVYDEVAFSLNGTWDTDARLCLQAVAPKPCTVLAAVIDVEGHDR